MRAVSMAVESANSEACVNSIREPYLQALSSVERLLEVIKDEFERRGRSEIAAVQGLLLYSIGSQELSVGAHARLLSRHECHIQSQEAGGPRGWSNTSDASIFVRFASSKQQMAWRFIRS